jgi:DNA-binding NtrC family response regulator
MQNETILLVEDEPSLRSVCKMFLEYSGYQVLDADNAVDALFIVSEHRGPIHLLFTDIDMMPMSGVELAEQLVILRPETQVLFMSGQGIECVESNLSAFRARFLPKPFNPKGMHSAVVEALSQAA